MTVEATLKKFESPAGTASWKDLQAVMLWLKLDRRAIRLLTAGPRKLTDCLDTPCSTKTLIEEIKLNDIAKGLTLSGYR